MQHAYILSNNNTNYSLGRKVKKGQIMVMRGHMVKNRKGSLSHLISLGAQLSFDIHHAYVTNGLVLRSSEVNECQPEVSHLTSNLFRHIFFVMLMSSAFIWQQHAYIQWFCILKFLRLVNGSQKNWPIAMCWTMNYEGLVKWKLWPLPNPPPTPGIKKQSQTAHL